MSAQTESLSRATNAHLMRSSFCGLSPRWCSQLLGVQWICRSGSPHHRAEMHYPSFSSRTAVGTRTAARSALNGYGPLAHYWATHGLVVIQPTHLSSKTLSTVLDPGDPEAALYRRSRAEDMTRTIDQLDLVQASVTEISGPWTSPDRRRRSMGGDTASPLLGMRPTDPRPASEVDPGDPRVTVTGAA